MTARVVFLLGMVSRSQCRWRVSWSVIVGASLVSRARILSGATQATLRLDRQLLAAWLDFVSGSVDLQQLIDPNGLGCGAPPAT